MNLKYRGKKETIEIQGDEIFIYPNGGRAGWNNHYHYRLSQVKSVSHTGGGTVSFFLYGNIYGASVEGCNTLSAQSEAIRFVQGLNPLLRETELSFKGKRVYIESHGSNSKSWDCDVSSIKRAYVKSDFNEEYELCIEYSGIGIETIRFRCPTRNNAEKLVAMVNSRLSGELVTDSSQVKIYGDDSDNSNSHIEIRTIVNGVVFIKPQSEKEIEIYTLAKYAKFPYMFLSEWMRDEYKLEYGIDDCDKYILGLKAKGLLTDASLPRALANLTNDELKRILSNYGLKKTGRKAELVNRILDEVSSEEVKSALPCQVYSLTEKGKEYLLENTDLLNKWFIDSEKVVEKGRDLGERPVIRESKPRSSKKSMPNPTEDELRDQVHSAIEELYDEMNGNEDSFYDLFSIGERKDLLMLADGFITLYPKPVDTIVWLKKYIDEEKLREIANKKYIYQICNSEEFIKIVHRISKRYSWIQIEETLSKLLKEYIKRGDYRDANMVYRNNHKKSFWQRLFGRKNENGK